METIIRLWKIPSTGRLISTISGMVSFISGRKMRSTALPIQPSSIGGFPHDGGGIDWIFSVRDAGEMKNRIEIFERIEAGMIAKRAFRTELIKMDVAL